MIVCDNCKRVGEIAFSCFITLLKQEEKGKKDTDREVKRHPIDLCENCITGMISRLGRFITEIRKSPVDKSPVEKEKQDGIA